MTAPAESSKDPSRSPTSLSPEAARAAASNADARAAEARAVADHAKSIAKEARTAAGKASMEAAKFREAADPVARERAELTPAQAKARLLEAARKINPLGEVRAAVREHPFTVVGVAAGAGVVLGCTGGLIGNVIGGGAKVTAALLGLARPRC